MFHFREGLEKLNSNIEYKERRGRHLKKDDNFFLRDLKGVVIFWDTIVIILVSAQLTVVPLNEKCNMGM